MPAVVDDAGSWVSRAPTLVCGGESTLDLGGRAVRVLHPGRGNTRGRRVAAWVELAYHEAKAR